jgi:uncharacterized protein YraI
MKFRKLAVVAAGLIGTITPLVATANPASAAGTGTVNVGAGYTLRVRSAPNTTASVVGAIPHGAQVNLECWVSGAAVAGNWGTTTLWHRANGGYISDGFVYTGTNGPASGEPSCSAPAPAPSSSKADRALAWARGQLGATGWNGWCDRFVANAYGRTSSGYSTAYVHYQDLNRRGLINRTGTPPAGAMVFFAPAAVNGNAGHVMISEGNGSYITSAARVQRVGLSWPGSSYLGWAYGNPEWPGR